MIKNRTTQLIFQTVYCVLAVIGFINSLGYFDANFNENFYVYYTNLSNYICLGMMFCILRQTVRHANKKEDGYCSIAPTFNFLCVILILVTFLVYNILLADENTVVQYFTSLSNMLLHVILPLMFILNWVLFYEHGKLKWHYPLLSMIMPLIYVIFILIRAPFVTPGPDAVIYPYFFLDIGTLGWGGFALWVVVLLAVFVVIGYLIYALDRLKIQKRGTHHA